MVLALEQIPTRCPSSVRVTRSRAGVRGGEAKRLLNECFSGCALTHALWMCCVLRGRSNIQFEQFRINNGFFLEYLESKWNQYLSASMWKYPSVCAGNQILPDLATLQSVKVTWQSEKFFFSEFFGAFFAVGLGIFPALFCYSCLRSLLLLCCICWEGCGRLQVHLCFTSVNPI